MWTVRWGVYNWDDKGRTKNNRRQRGSESFNHELMLGDALAFFLRKEASPRWDWVTLDSDKTVN